VFDISFFELLIVAIVGLVVIGPERLPETVRSISLWIGRLKRSLRETRSEIERQLGADDIRRQLHNEEVMQSLERTRREIENAMHESQNLLSNTAIDQEKSEQRKLPTYVDEGELPDHAHMDDPAHVNQTSLSTIPPASEAPTTAPDEPTSKV